MVDQLSAHAAALAALPSGVIAIGQDDRITIMTPAATQLLQVDADRWLNQPFADLCGELRLPDLLGDQPQRHWSGEQYVTLRLITPTPALQRADLQLLLFVEPLAAEAMQAQDLVTTISHEFRTPLTLILGNSDLLLHTMAGALSDDQREFVGLIKRHAQNLAQLLNQLLLLHSLDTGSLPSNPQPTALGETLTRVLQRLTIKHTQGLPPYQLQLPADLPLLQADPDLLLHLFSHLIGWACAAALPAGQVTISAAAEGASVVVRVAQIGFTPSAEQRAQIFMRQGFYDLVQPGPYHGLSCSLSIAKLIVDHYRGQLTLVPHDGPGTCFQLTLPIA